MKGRNLPEAHHVVRLVSYARLEKDNSGNAIGLQFSAFQRKENEEGLSVTWMEYFGGDRKQQIASTVKAIRASLTVGKKSGFAIGNVGEVKAACASRKHKIRIIHWPEDSNLAHAELRQFPRDDQTLLEQLATSTWSELVLDSAIPPGALPAPDEPVDPI
jgi:hypothetical protein